MRFVPKQQQKNEHVASLNLRHTALLMLHACQVRKTAKDRSLKRALKRRLRYLLRDHIPHARCFLVTSALLCACVNRRTNQTQEHPGQKRLQYANGPVRTMSPAPDASQEVFRLQEPQTGTEETAPLPPPLPHATRKMLLGYMSSTPRLC